ncbi:hypothetical protein FHR81_002578 [Actinoalloteichus hoggarensis]|uniref:Putative membrane protein ArfC n=1 Tax=Actinoalloteichus hoggarensis TaxID=1470176 RepID=A0A221VXB7_9PSEU|nr:hypothetical protein [Actinoalloteichus hoggarensis]ASO18182.1 putative membrane protein ArfC [Actinoalloteichus hoggarensis]MBB5921538.1 hypothetical protein [Actinoalloteichus hoggarensis]
MTSIFGQVWLWSLLAFALGAFVTWALLVRPARQRLARLDAERAAGADVPDDVDVAQARPSPEHTRRDADWLRADADGDDLLAGLRGTAPDPTQRQPIPETYEELWEAEPAPAARPPLPPRMPEPPRAAPPERTRSDFFTERQSAPHHEEEAGEHRGQRTVRAAGPLDQYQGPRAEPQGQRRRPEPRADETAVIGTAGPAGLPESGRDVAGRQSRQALGAAGSRPQPQNGARRDEAIGWPDEGRERPSAQTPRPQDRRPATGLDDRTPSGALGRPVSEIEPAGSPAASGARFDAFEGAWPDGDDAGTSGRTATSGQDLGPADFPTEAPDRSDVLGSATQHGSRPLPADAFESAGPDLSGPDLSGSDVTGPGVTGPDFTESDSTGSLSARGRSTSEEGTESRTDFFRRPDLPPDPSADLHAEQPEPDGLASHGIEEPGMEQPAIERLGERRPDESGLNERSAAEHEWPSGAATSGERQADEETTAWPSGPDLPEFASPQATGPDDDGATGTRPFDQEDDGVWPADVDESPAETGWPEAEQSPEPATGSESPAEPSVGESLAPTPPVRDVANLPSVDASTPDSADSTRDSAREAHEDRPAAELPAMELSADALSAAAEERAGAEAAGDEPAAVAVPVADAEPSPVTDAEPEDDRDRPGRSDRPDREQREDRDRAAEETAMIPVVSISDDDVSTPASGGESRPFSNDIPHVAGRSSARRPEPTVDPLIGLDDLELGDATPSTPDEAREVDEAVEPDRPRSLFEPVLEADSAVPGPAPSGGAAEFVWFAGRGQSGGQGGTPPRPASPVPPGPPPAIPRPVIPTPSSTPGREPWIPIQDVDGNELDAATLAPKGAQPFGPGSAPAAPDGSAPTADYRIKANAKSRTYYTEQSPQFATAKAQVWFRSETDAQRAGFAPWHTRRSGSAGR